jgi:hypothetical protein
VLFAYGSGSPDPNAAAAYIASRTMLTDAIDIGQQVIPIVRDEVAKRDAREKALA